MAPLASWGMHGHGSGRFQSADGADQGRLACHEEQSVGPLPLTSGSARAASDGTKSPAARTASCRRACCRCCELAGRRLARCGAKDLTLESATCIAGLRPSTP